MSVLVICVIVLSNSTLAGINWQRKSESIEMNLGGVSYCCCNVNRVAMATYMCACTMSHRGCSVQQQVLSSSPTKVSACKSVH